MISPTHTLIFPHMHVQIVGFLSLQRNREHGNKSDGLGERKKKCLPARFTAGVFAGMRDSLFVWDDEDISIQAAICGVSAVDSLSNLL